MSWLVSLMWAAVPTWMVAGQPFPVQQARSAPWWSGRALAVSVIHFSLALFCLVLMVLALCPQGR